MAVHLLCLVLFLAMTHHSSGTYCICKDGLSDLVLQKNIDYACGAGADCTPISQTGACYNPNTVKDHCNYAVNSYFQRKGQVSGSCDFAGTANTSLTVPNQSSGCVYPSSAGNSTTPSPPGTGTGTGTGTPPPSTPPSAFGFAPSGNGGITNTGSSSTILQTTHLFFSFILILVVPGFSCWRVQFL